MNENKDFIQSEADKLFGDSYRQGEGHCAPTNPENRFDEAPASVESLTPAAEAVGIKPVGTVASPPSDDEPVMAFDYPVVDYISQLYAVVAVGAGRRQGARLGRD